MERQIVEIGLLGVGKGLRVVVLLLLLLGICGGVGRAQTLQTTDGVKHGEVDFSAGLNTDGYEVEVGVAYFPIQFIGIKSQLGFAGELKAVEDWGLDEEKSGHHYAVRFKFMPSVVVRSPMLLNWRQQEAGLYLFAEPGVVLSPGASGSKGAKVATWKLRTGITMQFDRSMVFVGYGISDFSLYSGRPYNQHGLPSDDNYITHSVFIGMAYKF